MTTIHELQHQKRQETREHGEPTRSERQYLPAVDIHETGEAVIVEAEMPGIAKEGVELHLEDGILTIFAGMPAGKTESAEIMLHREYESGNYLRRFSVAESIDQEKISAVMTDGILTLTLPKQQPTPPKKIEIKTS